MSKFKPGQQVICINADNSYLDYLHCYTIKYGDFWQVGPTEVMLEEESLTWLESRFEDADEWAKHQKPVVL